MRDDLSLPAAFAARDDDPKCVRIAAEHYTESLWRFILTYKWLAEIHNVEYLVHAPIEQHVPAWKEDLSAVTIGEAHTLITDIDKHAPASSLKEFFAKTAELTLPRSVGDESQVQPLHPELKMGTKEKKVYEVERLASVVVQAANEHGCSAAVDCGAGSGRLARCLAMQYGLSVTAVECSELHTTVAQVPSTA